MSKTLLRAVTFTLACVLMLCAPRAGAQDRLMEEGGAGGVIAIPPTSTRTKRVSTPTRTRRPSRTTTASVTASATATVSSSATASATRPTMTATPIEGTRIATVTAVGTRTPTATSTRPPTPTMPPMPPCAGDCDGNDRVEASELIIAVNIALGVLPPSRCPAVDRDGDGSVGIADVVRALNAALLGCPARRTPTATPEPDCPDPGANPATGCTTCRPRFHTENAFGILAPEGLADDESIATQTSVAEEHRRCVPDAFCSPSNVHCSGRGSCVDLPGGSAGCDCPPGYTGVNCENCLPPFVPVLGGGCVPGGGCEETMCSGHGACIMLGAIITCACHPGFGGEHCGASAFDLHPVGHSVEAGETITMETSFENPGGCGSTVDWEIVTGDGSLSGDDTTAPYTAPDAVAGLLDVVTVRAAPANCPELADEESIHVVAAGVGPIIGRASEEFEGVDEVVLQFIADHVLPGGSMTLSFQEQRVYNKAFGFAIPDEMTPGHIMRLASVSKPITRAAIRELQAAGLLNGGANGLNDSVFNILQVEGGNLLSLDATNSPIAPLVDADYLGSTAVLCDTATPPNCPPVGGPPLACPVGVVAGAPLCPLNLAGAAGGFTIPNPTWNVDGANPRIGGSPQYSCPTDDNGQLDVAMWQRMTVSDLFWHRGGFYRGAGYNDVANGNNAKSGDLQGEPIFVSQRMPLNHAPPPTALDLIRFAAGSCLYYPPVGCDDTCCVSGSQPNPVDAWGYCTQLDNNTYSNIGYNILGQVIEVRSGMPYADYVKQSVLDPLGIADIRPGRTRPADRDPREPLYVTNGAVIGGNVFAAVCEGGDPDTCAGGTWTFPELVAAADGGDWALEYRNPSGGWTATSCDLNRLFTTYRVTDGFRRMPGVFPGGGEGTMMGANPGTRAYVAQWGDPINIVDTVNVPMGCTSWGCLTSNPANFALGPGWHLAAIFNKDLCDSGTCDAPGGYVFATHDKSAFLNSVAAALTKVTTLPAEEEICGCGNGFIDVGEQCDGHDLAGQTCTSLGFPGGQLACKSDCTFDTQPCMLCGNGMLDEYAGEVCDGTEFGGTSCASFGFEMGDLLCNACNVIDPSQCHGGMSLQPPVSYKACGFDFDDPDNPADCSNGTCANADGTCPGGPCKPTNSGDQASALDPLNLNGGEFHPDGDFRAANGTLFYCQLDPDDASVHMVCIDEDGWGVCKRCSPFDGEHNTLVGCPCHGEEECASAIEPSLSCFGDDYGPGLGFCWDGQDGPPIWQCVEGSCGQAVYYHEDDDDDDEMYCEHYPLTGNQARCMPSACNPQLARVCASEGLICAEDAGPVCADDSCCGSNCETDADCSEELGWPPDFTCEGPDQSHLVCVLNP